ncbi:MAG: carboxymuconolactone decarboxylase family protein [Bryobacteraceae bacterium]
MKPIAPRPIPLPIDPHDAPMWMRMIFAYARRIAARLTGKAIVPAPVRMMAHQPRLLLGAAAMETALSRMDSVPKRAKLLAEMQVARLAGCRYCIDIGSAIAARAGVREHEILALPDFEGDPHFDAMDRAVLRYATGMSRTPAAVSPADLHDLRRYCDDRQIIELTAVIAWENQRVRFNQALHIAPDGFRAGLPEPEHAAAR